MSKYFDEDDYDDGMLTVILLNLVLHDYFILISQNILIHS